MPVAGIVAQAASAAMGKIGGLAQLGIGFFGGRKARKQLENLQSPTYTPAKSISDYYHQALNRYNENPYQSNLYKLQAQNIARGTAQGLSSLQDRRSALAGVAGLIQGQNDALLKAGVAAEQQRDQRFAQLGGASQAMGAEQRQAFNINQMQPFERKYNQLAQKAAGYNQLFNAGLSNYFGGAQSGGMAAASAYGASGGMSGFGSGGSAANNYYQDSDLPPSTYKVPLAKY